MSDLGDKARDDFLSEAQEIIDQLSRDLLLLDATSRVGPPDPDLINAVFRAVHTLKGLSGLFNAAHLSALSHELENLLDDLRLGKRALTAELFDLLFRAVELYNRLLAADKVGRPEEAQTEYEIFMQEVRGAESVSGAEQPTVMSYDLDPGILAVLTEYEEHRLRTAVSEGLNLYRIRVVFQLTTIDEGLEDLKHLVKPLGEILTYLPTGSGGDSDSIELEILAATSAEVSVVRDAVASMNASVEEIAKRSEPTHAPSAGPVGLGPPDSVPGPRPESILPMALPNRMTMPPGPDAGWKGAPLVARPDVSLRSVAQTVRVDIQRLDHLMNLLGELAIVRSGISRAADSVRGNRSQRELSRELDRLLHGFNRHLSAMQAGILEVRMVPLGQVFEKLARVARQSSRQLGKAVNLVITGAETEVDKLIGEELSDPLMHMIRNALDHGIEDDARRDSVGKPPAGTIALNAYQKGNQVVVEVEDDGGGIEEGPLIQAAIQAGVLADDDVGDMSRHEALGLIFMPGVTTRRDPGPHSGRGVGMDVVKTNIGKLGGVVDVQSEVGIGTKFTITLPITLAIISALMVRIGSNTYAVPLSSVQEAILVEVDGIRSIESREIVTVRGESLPLCRLGVVFGEGAAETRLVGRLLVVVGSAASRRCGFVVDDILGRQDIVIKALTGPLRGIRGFAGATELGDQRIGLVLDIPGLLEEALTPVGAPRLVGGL